MLISLIAAVAANRVIGHQGQMPWTLPGDLQRFRQLALGHHLLMGRATCVSIGRLLPGRKTFVLSRDPVFSLAGCRVFDALEKALEVARNSGETELFVCGGEEVYRQALPLCHRIYLTELMREVEGDRVFPEVPPNEFRRTRTLLTMDTELCRFSVFDRLKVG